MKSQNTWKLFWGWHHVERGHNVTTLHFFTEGGRITAKKYKPFVTQEVCTSEYLWRIPAERKKNIQVTMNAFCNTFWTILWHLHELEINRYFVHS